MPTRGNRKNPVDRSKRAILREGGLPNLPPAEIRQAIEGIIASSRGTNRPKVLRVSPQMIEKHKAIKVGRIDIPTRIPTDLLAQMASPASRHMERFMNTAEGQFELNNLSLDVLRLPFKPEIFSHFAVGKGVLNLKKGMPFLWIKFHKIFSGRKGRSLSLLGSDGIYSVDGILLAIIEKQPYFL